MQEQKLNILSKEALDLADAVCFTANGIVKKDGTLVMGAGVAKAFANRYPWLPKSVGNQVREFGNRVHNFWSSQDGVNIVSFPTKHHWRNFSDLELIKQSAKELMDLAKENDWNRIYITRPGCGLGGLKWATVKAELEKIFDDRVVVCYL